MLIQLQANVARWWSDHGRRTEEYQPFPVVEGRNMRQEFLEIPAMVAAFGLPRGGRILEVGCGLGVGLEALNRCLKPRQLVGLEIDDHLAGRARANLSAAGVDAEVITGDVRAIPFPDGAFDLVIDFGTLYHIARAERAVFEIARVLEPGGQFVYETRVSQMLSHPVRSRGRALPRRALNFLGPRTSRLLWARRTRRVGQD